MNADNITDVQTQVSGAMYVAPSGTTLPTDASTALPAAFKQLGYAHKDGLVIQENRDTVQWDTWEADDVVRVSNAHTVDISFKTVEPFNEQAAKLLFGSANVEVEDGNVSAIHVNGGELDEVVLVAEMLLRDGTKMRAIAGRFKVTEPGEMDFKRGEMLAPEVKGAALGGAGADKVTYYFA